jgi:DNA-binding transcriptional MerR regulator
MAHERAKLILEQVESFRDRMEAVKKAMDHGMPLSEIEEYLDWLQLNREVTRPKSAAENEKPEDKPPSKD